MEYRNKDAHESTLDIIDNLIKSGRKIMEEKTNIYGTIVVHCESGKVLSVIKNDSSDQMDVEKELLKKIELVDERIL